MTTLDANSSIAAQGSSKAKSKGRRKTIVEGGS